MKIDEIQKLVDDVDRRLNKLKKVAAEEKSLNLTGAYRRYGWGETASPVPGPALKTLSLEDKTGDKRWSDHFKGNQVHLALYRTQVGFYWLLRFDSGMGEHWLDHIGAAQDVVAKFGE